MRLAVVTAHLDVDWHSQSLVAACEAVAPTDVIEPGALSLSGHGVLANGRDVRHWTAWLLARPIHGGDPDAQCVLYQAMADAGATLVNPVAGLIAAQDKGRTSWLLARAGVPTPRFVVAQTLARAREALRAFGRAVLKPASGSLGTGVVRVDADDPKSDERLKQELEDEGVLYLQRRVTGCGGEADDRLFVVGDRVRACVRRWPASGDFRGNRRQGARSTPHEASADAEDAAVRATRALGLEYAGVDVVESDEGPVVLEVNGTPHWRPILEATGASMAEAIVRHAIERATGS